jgi:hypothetical protein
VVSATIGLGRFPVLQKVSGHLMSIAGVVSAAPTAPARWRSRFVNRGESPADCMPPVSESRRATSLRKSVEATLSPAEAAAAANCTAARRPAAICGSSAVGDPHPRWNDPTTVPTGWSTSGSREQRRLGPGEVGVTSPLGGGEDECGLVQAEAARQIARLTTKLSKRCVIYSKVGPHDRLLRRPFLAPTPGTGSAGQRGPRAPRTRDDRGNGRATHRPGTTAPGRTGAERRHGAGRGAGATDQAER